NEIPPEAFDSPAERGEMGKILDEYNRRGARLDGDLSDRLYTLARAHRARHPFDYWVRLPFLRVVTRLFPPRDGYALGTLPTLLYDELAPWFHLLTAPEDYVDEAAAYRDAILGAASPRPVTLLELGSGGGNNASHLKRDFTCTLTDLSPAMLAVSRTINPGC